MKIGILTFHSQLNYGGVLQCWALQTVLRKLGHEVVIIDRWLDAKNYSLLGRNINGFARRLVRNIFDIILRRGEKERSKRRVKTINFLKSKLICTPYHFYQWCEYEDVLTASGDTAVDCIVVGSDQVWRGGEGTWGDPLPYLLDGAPDIPAIAYAASFGMLEIPERLVYGRFGATTIPGQDAYKQGFSRFSFISCREKSGVSLCNRLGFHAAYVSDPTLLLREDEWVSGLQLQKHKSSRRTLLCYFIRENLQHSMKSLESFARSNNCDVHVLVDCDILPLPVNLSSLKLWLSGVVRKISYPHVKVWRSAGPVEFVDEFYNANWVVSDSFHALMFSIVFEKNVRIIKPSSAERLGMFSRIEELATHMSNDLVSVDLPSALLDLRQGRNVQMDHDWLMDFVFSSMKFLRESLLDCIRGKLI